MGAVNKDWYLVMREVQGKSTAQSRLREDSKTNGKQGFQRLKGCVGGSPQVTVRTPKTRRKSGCWCNGAMAMFLTLASVKQGDLHDLNDSLGYVVKSCLQTIETRDWGIAQLVE